MGGLRALQLDPGRAGRSRGHGSGVPPDALRCRPGEGAGAGQAAEWAAAPPAAGAGGSM